MNRPALRRPSASRIRFGIPMGDWLGDWATVLSCLSRWTRAGAGRPTRVLLGCWVGAAVCCAAVVPAFGSAGSWSLDEVGGVASTHVRVRLSPQVALTTRDDGRPTVRGVEASTRLAVESILDDFAATGATRARSVVPGDAARAARVGLDRYWHIPVPAGTDTPRLAEALRATGAFEIVELDGIGGVSGGGDGGALLPDDPFFNLQYGLHNVGQVVSGQGGVPGADIDAPGAWSKTTSGDGVVIAVLDSGINVHVELSGRVLGGWNVPHQTTLTVDGCSSHGTHVSGILAAKGDNGIGVAGLVWDAQLLPVVVVDGCTGLEAWLADGIVWAVDHGADLLNMSLQYSVGSDYLKAAVQYAADAGIVMVAATGNSNGPVSFPARWPETIAVAATDNVDARWPQSNFGPQVDVAAPGWQIYSLSGTSAYSYKSGTSMATPHVTGLAALLRSVNPGLAAAEIRALIASGADDVSLPGFDVFTGHGRVNAATSIALALPAATEGDLNSDGMVNAVDLAILLSNWGPCPDCEGQLCPADLSLDCMVDGSDLSLLLAAWGN